MAEASSSNKEPYILTKYQILGDVAIESPKAAELLAAFGLHCISCFANSFDTLEMGARVHGMDDAEIDDMIVEINKELREEYEKNS